MIQNVFENEKTVSEIPSKESKECKKVDIFKRNKRNIDETNDFMLSEKFIRNKRRAEREFLTLKKQYTRCKKSAAPMQHPNKCDDIYERFVHIAREISDKYSSMTDILQELHPEQNWAPLNIPPNIDGKQRSKHKFEEKKKKEKKEKEEKDTSSSEEEKHTIELENGEKYVIKIKNKTSTVLNVPTVQPTEIPKTSTTEKPTVEEISEVTTHKMASKLFTATEETIIIPKDVSTTPIVTTTTTTTATTTEKPVTHTTIKNIEHSTSNTPLAESTTQNLAEVTPSHITLPLPTISTISSLSEPIHEIKPVPRVHEELSAEDPHSHKKSFSDKYTILQPVNGANGRSSSTNDKTKSLNSGGTTTVEAMGPSGPFITLCEKLSKQQQQQQQTNINQMKQQQMTAFGGTPNSGGVQIHSIQNQFTSRGPQQTPMTGESMKASAQVLMNPGLSYMSNPVCFHAIPIQQFRSYIPQQMWNINNQGFNANNQGYIYVPAGHMQNMNTFQPNFQQNFHTGGGSGFVKTVPTAGQG